MNWIPVSGHFEVVDSELVFRGEQLPWKDEKGETHTVSAVGVAICNESFAGGEITAKVQFESLASPAACELIVYWDPEHNAHLSVGLGLPPGMFTIRLWDGKENTRFAASGDPRNLKAKRWSDLRVSVRGSRIRLFVDGVEAVAAVLPFSVPASQVGVVCIDREQTRVSEFRVCSRKGRVFVVMQLSSPYNEIYREVVKKICAEEYEVRNAEETVGPGLIMADVLQDIAESESVVADVTPSNPNVYYELVVADAIGKPVIMVADRANLPRLPFDISSARVLFYENTIAGKEKFEAQLRLHIKAIQARRPMLPLDAGGLARQRA